jgi:hypothetical protein
MIPTAGEVPSVLPSKIVWTEWTEWTEYLPSFRPVPIGTEGRKYSKKQLRACGRNARCGEWTEANRAPSEPFRAESATRDGEPLRPAQEPFPAAVGDGPAPAGAAPARAFSGSRKPVSAAVGIGPNTRP